MEIVKLKLHGLTPYYLSEKIYDFEKSGLKITWDDDNNNNNSDDDDDTCDSVVLEFEDLEDLNNKISHILTCLTDK